MIKAFNNKNNIVLSQVILGLLGAVIVLYALFLSDFAEIHISPFFLNFPIFIGEVVMLVAFLVYVFFLNRKAVTLTKAHEWFFIYFLVVVLRAGIDYVQWGPLALRNAALFYYPIFAVFSYTFWQFRGFSNNFYKWLIIPVLMVVFGLVNVGYFYLSCVLLAIIFIYSMTNRQVKIILTVIVLFNIPYASFFNDSRTNIMGVAAAFVFIGYMLVRYFWKAQAWLKWSGMLVGVLVFGVGLYSFADKNGLKTMINPWYCYQIYKDTNEEIKNRLRDYKSQSLRVRLYHDNKLAHRITPVQGPTSVVLRPQLPLTIRKEEKVLLSQVQLKAAPAKLKKVKEEKNNFSHVAVSEPPIHIQVVKPQEIKTIPVEAKVKEEVQQQGKSSQNRSLTGAYLNILFRVYIWQDMIEELWQKKAVLGVGLGQPQRSRRIEILEWAATEWSKDGWITPHNSYLHMIYRMGVLGLIMQIILLIVFLKLVRRFIYYRSLQGILLCGMIIYWAMTANFLAIFEFPYFAIPFWTLVGIVLAFAKGLGRTDAS